MARRKNGAAEAQDGSVTIDLNRPPPETVEDKPPDYGAAPAEEAKAPERAEPASEPRFEENDLETQIKSLKAREQAASQRAHQAEAARAADAQRVQQAWHQHRGEVEQAQYDSVANALLARQNEVAVLKQQLIDAKVRGDTQAEVELTDKMQDAKVEIKTLTDGKAEIERAYQQRAQQPPPQYQQPQYQPPPQQYQQPTVEQVLAQMPALIDSERDWLRRHPDALSDQRQVLRLQAAYIDAQEQGIERGSRDYFDFFNDRLGYHARDDEPQYDEVDTMQQRTSNQRPISAAPPSRSSPGMSAPRYSGGGSVTLSPAEREAAKISNISEHEYARNKLKLAERKRQGMYGERG